MEGYELHKSFLVDCSPLHTTLYEAANPDTGLLGASRLRDLRILRRTEYADLGNPPTEAERLDAWQDLGGREQQQYGHYFPQPPDADDVPTPSTPEQQAPPHPVSSRPRDNSVTRQPRVNIGNYRPRERLNASSHNQLRIAAHTTNQPTRLACTTNQDPLLVMDRQSMSMCQIMLRYPRSQKCPVKSLILERKRTIQIPNPFESSLSKNIRLSNHRCSSHNILSHWYHIHEYESPRNGSRCARETGEQFKFQCSSRSFQ